MLTNRVQILYGNVVWGALVFMFFEIFRKHYSFGEIGEKFIFAAAILDFGGHLGFSNWPHMIFIISTIWRYYVPSFMLVSQSERFPLFFPISNSTIYIVCGTYNLYSVSMTRSLIRRRHFNVHFISLTKVLIQPLWHVGIS